VIFAPLDFIARLTSLIPTPRVNLVRCHGVFAPHHQLRAQIVPVKRGRQTQTPGPGGQGAAPAERARAMCERPCRDALDRLDYSHTVCSNTFCIRIGLYNKPLDHGRNTQLCSCH
jgi:hypothetical protein